MTYKHYHFDNPSKDLRWQVTEEEEDCSGVGGILLDNSAQCQLAAEDLGKIYSESVSWHDVPKGCILSVSKSNYNNVFWNTHTGRTQTGYRAICKIAGKNYIERCSINVYYN